MKYSPSVLSLCTLPEAPLATTQGNEEKIEGKEDVGDTIVPELGTRARVAFSLTAFHRLSRRLIPYEMSLATQYSDREGAADSKRGIPDYPSLILMHPV